MTTSRATVDEATGGRGSLLGARLRPYLPEVVVTVFLVLAFVIGSLMSPFFLDTEFLFKEALLYMEMGLLALGLTLVIVSGNLDLSVASNLAMVASVTAYLHARQGFPMELTILIGLGLGALGGAFNGILVAWLGLPSLTVTLATLALYRGIAQILLGDHSVQDMPQWFLGIDRITVPGTLIPMPFVIFLLLALVFGLLLHKTVLGRWIYALGTNRRAAYFSGVPVKRVILVIFTLSGLMAGLGALMLNSRLMVARYDHARGWELDAITAVVLGGTSIFGGRGTVYGTVVALFLLATLRTAMGVANVKVEAQLAVIGSLLIAAVVLTDALARRGRKR